MSDCCQKEDLKSDSKKGFLSGLIYGLIPHFGCLMFLVFTVLGVTALSAIFKPLLLSRYFFYLLIALSSALTTISAIVYLRRKSLLSFSGVKMKLRYLLTLYAVTVSVNLFLFFIVFPYATNFQASFFWGKASIADSANVSKMTIEVEIPCSGHAPLVVDELKKSVGIKDVKFRLPNRFDVYYDKSKISETAILSLDIFRDFKAKILTG